MMLRIIKPCYLMLFMMAISVKAIGASFDCNKSITNIEYMICLHPQLSSMDETIDVEYINAKRYHTDEQIKAIIRDQRNWLNNERNTCVGTDCLLKSYFYRIAELTGASGTSIPYVPRIKPEFLKNVFPRPYSVNLHASSLIIEASFTTSVNCYTATSENIYIVDTYEQRIHGSIECSRNHIRFQPSPKLIPTNSVLRIVISPNIAMANGNKFEGYTWPILTENWSLGNSFTNLTYEKDIVTDNESNIYLTGTTVDAVGISKLSWNGGILWNRQLQVGKHDGGESITIGKNGNIYVAGFTYSPTLPNGDPLGKYAIVVSYSNDGTKRWIKKFEKMWDDAALDITSDKDGYLYVVGENCINDGRNCNSDATNTDAFIKKMDDSGRVLWEREFGSNRHDAATSVALDTNGNVIVAGWTYGNIGSDKPNNGRSIFITKFDSDGSMKWSKTVLSGGWNYPKDIAIDTDDSIYVVGHMPAEEGGALLMKVDNDGDMIWTKPFGSDPHGLISSVILDNKGAVYILGKYNGNLNFLKFSVNGDNLWSHIMANYSNVKHGLALDKEGDILVVTNDGIGRTIRKFNSNGDLL